MQIAFFILLFVLGVCFGSFLCCQARRLRLKETKKKPLGRRSVCLHCHYQLKWYDNLPLISWLMLKGRCRKCHHKIGLAEFLSELGLGLAFPLIGYGFISSIALPPLDQPPLSLQVPCPLAWILLIVTLIFTLILGFLAIYDGLYGELPTLALTLSLICAITVLVFKEYAILTVTPFSFALIYQPLLSILVLGGVYLVLYLVSKGHWVGDGDWLLGTAIAIVLGDPWLAIIALFLANTIACLIMYPATRLKKNHQIHFGPFLVIAFVIVYGFTKFFLSVL